MSIRSKIFPGYTWFGKINTHNACIPLCFGVQYIQRTAKRHSEYIRDASFLMFGQRQNFLAESCRKAGHTRKDNKV